MPPAAPLVGGARRPTAAAPRHPRRRRPSRTPDGTASLARSILRRRRRRCVASPGSVLRVTERREARAPRSPPPALSCGSCEGAPPPCSTNPGTALRSAPHSSASADTARTNAVSPSVESSTPRPVRAHRSPVASAGTDSPAARRCAWSEPSWNARNPAKPSASARGDAARATREVEDRRHHAHLELRRPLQRDVPELVLQERIGEAVHHLARELLGAGHVHARHDLVEQRRAQEGAERRMLHRLAHGRAAGEQRERDEARVRAVQQAHLPQAIRADALGDDDAGVGRGEAQPLAQRRVAFDGEQPIRLADRRSSRRRTGAATAAPPRTPRSARPARCGRRACCRTARASSQARNAGSTFHRCASVTTISRSLSPLSSISSVGMHDGRARGVEAARARAMQEEAR